MLLLALLRFLRLVAGRKPGRLALLEEGGDALFTFRRNADLRDLLRGVLHHRIVYFARGDAADQLLDARLRRHSFPTQGAEHLPLSARKPVPRLQGLDQNAQQVQSRLEVLVGGEIERPRPSPKSRSVGSTEPTSSVPPRRVRSKVPDYSALQV